MTWDEALAAHGFTRETDNPASWLRLNDGQAIRAAAVRFSERDREEFAHDSEADVVRLQCNFDTPGGRRFITAGLAYPDPVPIGIMLEDFLQCIERDKAVHAS